MFTNLISIIGLVSLFVIVYRIGRLPRKSTKQEEFRAHNIQEFDQSIFNLEIEQAFDLKRLSDMEGNPDRKVKLDGYNAKIASLITSKTGKTIKDKEQIDAKIEKIRFEKSKLVIPQNKLYEEIHTRAHQIKGVKEMIQFIKYFKPSDAYVELPYAEVDGTRYEMKDNMYVLDDNKNRMLHMKPGAVAVDMVSLKDEVNDTQESH